MIGIMKKASGTSDVAVTRRRVLASMAAFLGTYEVASAAPDPILPRSEPFGFPPPLPYITEQVAPKAGMPTAIAFQNSIQKLIAGGAIDPRKFRALAGDLPAWVERLLRAPSDDPIVFSRETAPYLLDLLWPIGLSNKAAFNEQSPIYTVRLPSFASTGGWTLGQEPSGYVYFNKIEAMRMTADQQARVMDVATTTFRPCCDNSTFFQDCNHGSALLGLLELAAARGATAERLYAIALTANSYWFPDNYAETALYFWHFHRKTWREVDPRLILSAAFSSLGGWETNINDRLLRANVRLPGNSNGQQAC